MTSPGYKKGKRFRWIILRAALWVEISKQARVEGGKFQGWIQRTHTRAFTRTAARRHTRTLCPPAALGKSSALFSPSPLFFFFFFLLSKIPPKSFDSPSPPASPALHRNHPPSPPRPVPAALPRHGLGHACEHVQHRQHPGGQTSLQGLGAAAPERRARRLPQPPRGLALRQRLRLRRILLPGGGTGLGAAGGRRVPARLQQLLLRAAACARVPRGPLVLWGRAGPGSSAVLLRPPRR